MLKLRIQALIISVCQLLIGIYLNENPNLKTLKHEIA